MKTLLSWLNEEEANFAHIRSLEVLRTQASAGHLLKDVNKDWLLLSSSFTISRGYFCLHGCKIAAASTGVVSVFQVEGPWQRGEK